MKILKVTADKTGTDTILLTVFTENNPLKFLNPDLSDTIYNPSAPENLHTFQTDKAGLAELLSNLLSIFEPNIVAKEVPNKHKLLVLDLIKINSTLLNLLSEAISEDKGF